MAKRSEYSELSLDLSASGDNIVIAGVSGRITGVFKLWFVVSADVAVVFKSGTTALNGAIPMKANGSFVLDNDGTPWFSTQPGEDFIINLGGAVPLAGRIYYRQEL